MATYFPPQQLHETDSVYDTIRGLGGVLYMPPGNANGVNQFVYPDDSTLAGTVAGTPTFDQSGLIPEILGGSPLATLDAVSDEIRFTVPLGDPLQMSGGGTWIVLCTPAADDATVYPFIKSSAQFVRNGYAFTLRAGGTMRWSTSEDSAGASNITSTLDFTYSAGDRLLLIATLGGTAGKLYSGSTLIASGAMESPSNIACDLTVGNHPTNPVAFGGSVEVAALIPGVVLTQTQIATIADQCGPLG